MRWFNCVLIEIRPFSLKFKYQLTPDLLVRDLSFERILRALYLCTGRIQAHTLINYWFVMNSLYRHRFSVCIVIDPIYLLFVTHCLPSFPDLSRCQEIRFYCLFNKAVFIWGNCRKWVRCILINGCCCFSLRFCFHYITVEDFGHHILCFIQGHVRGSKLVKGLTEV
jgi:hypothetical protein